MEVIKHSKIVKRFGCVGSCVSQKLFLHWKSTHDHVGGFCNKYVQERFLFIHCCLLFRYKSTFSELGHMPPHPTHDSAKSSPNVRVSCPTQYCLHRCSQLVFISKSESLDQLVHRLTFCSPKSTVDAGIFFWWSPKLPKLFLVFQTADPTAHKRSTLFDANGPSQSMTVLSFAARQHLQIFQAKVYVFADSVLCLCGKCQLRPIRRNLGARANFVFRRFTRVARTPRRRRRKGSCSSGRFSQGTLG